MVVIFYFLFSLSSLSSASLLSYIFLFFCVIFSLLLLSFNEVPNSSLSCADPDTSVFFSYLFFFSHLPSSSFLANIYFFSLPVNIHFLATPSSSSSLFHFIIFSHFVHLSSLLIISFLLNPIIFVIHFLFVHFLLLPFPFFAFVYLSGTNCKLSILFIFLSNLLISLLFIYLSIRAVSLKASNKSLLLSAGLSYFFWCLAFIFNNFHLGSCFQIILIFSSNILFFLSPPLPSVM